MSKCLKLIPSFIGETQSNHLPLRTLEQIYGLDHFIVEKEKTARAFLKSIGHPIVQSKLVIHELDKHHNYDGFQQFMQEHSKHTDIGLISEAGLPAVADPGAKMVAFAHHLGMKVMPLAGSSSIFLALMASGMNGQNFHFHGYLPIDRDERIKRLKELERQSNSCTQIFMEAPYRNNDFLAFLLNNLKADTRLCVACDLESGSELIISKKVKNWETANLNLHKRPCIYLIGC